MNNAQGTIMVVNAAAATADNLKELIEFMDAPEVRVATPAKWREVAEETRVEAVFLGPDLADDDVRQLLTGIGDLDPSIPIVMLDPEAQS
ncbi:MAG: hypothetical protein QNI98_04260 [Woeseiaceae bacterium]|nr:hypothetical protein [Woeseiaceae bacterium]